MSGAKEVVSGVLARLTIFILKYTRVVQALKQPRLSLAAYVNFDLFSQPQ